MHCKCLAVSTLDLRRLGAGCNPTSRLQRTISRHWRRECWEQPGLSFLVGLLGRCFSFLLLLQQTVETHCLTEGNLFHTVPDIRRLKMTLKIKDHRTKFVPGVLASRRL